MPDCESHSLGLEDQNVDIVPAEEWYKMADEIAAILGDFLARKLPQAQPQARGRVTAKESAARCSGRAAPDPNPASDLKHLAFSYG